MALCIMTAQVSNTHIYHCHCLSYRSNSVDFLLLYFTRNLNTVGSKKSVEIVERNRLMIMDEELGKENERVTQNRSKEND